jgi:hypothetical protein
MPLIKMIGANVEAERLQHERAADAENDLLLEPTSLVTTIKMMGDLSILRVVLSVVCVQQQHRNVVTERAMQEV